MRPFVIALSTPRHEILAFIDGTRKALGKADGSVPHRQASTKAGCQRGAGGEMDAERTMRKWCADSDEAAPLFRDDCAPGFRDDLAPCLVGSAGDDCCQFIQARCQALRGRFRRRLSPLNSMRWALWTNLSSMASA
ncbi:hypothetical protein C3L21_20660 (plasmid) [Sinorhizobium meliloti]|nr:hypothetical protein C3L21_20660 [Sinorhizobium meliloti]